MVYWTWTWKALATNLLNSDLFSYKQANMLLEKYENLLELSDKQLVKQSSLASLISLSQSMRSLWKTKMLMFFLAKLVVFHI